MPFQKGQSGNPKGRKKGSTNSNSYNALFKAAIKQKLPPEELADKIITMLSSNNQKVRLEMIKVLTKALITSADKDGGNNDNLKTFTVSYGSDRD